MPVVTIPPTLTDPPHTHTAGDQAKPQDTVDEDSRGVGSELRTERKLLRAAGLSHHQDRPGLSRTHWDAGPTGLLQGV